MNDLVLEPTQSSPEVKADFAAGTLEMRGDSYPENSFDFFVPLIAWINDFLKDASTRALKLELHLLYLNTSSVKVMMDIFDTLEDAHGDNRDVSVNWYYDADNARIAELAEEFKEDCTFPFEIVQSNE